MTHPPAGPGSNLKIHGWRVGGGRDCSPPLSFPRKKAEDEVQSIHAKPGEARRQVGPQ